MELCSHSECDDRQNGPKDLHAEWVFLSGDLHTGGIDGELAMFQDPIVEEVRAIRRPGDTIRSLAWSPDGSRLAVAADDGLANIYDPRTGLELLTLSGHTGAIYAIAWSPDGSRVATGSWDNTLRIWQPTTGRLLCSLVDQPSQITCLAWSSDGHRIASGDLAGKIVIRDSRHGHEVEAPAPYGSR